MKRRKAITLLIRLNQREEALKPLLDGQQQDAEEFLCLYLDALEEELPALLTSSSGRQSARPALELEVEDPRCLSQADEVEVKASWCTNLVESPITRIFGGKFCSHVRTSNKPDVTTEDWRSLHLDIQHDSIRTVQDALAYISQPQSGEQISASGSGSASQQVLIEALPPILVLHLDRVRYDVAAGGITKIGKSIQLAPELEIPLEPPHYKLYGVLYHHGESAGSGHYTVDVLHQNGDGGAGEVWLRIDDESVTRMRHEDVFGEYGAERAADEQFTHWQKVLLYDKETILLYFGGPYGSLGLDQNNNCIGGHRGPHDPVFLPAASKPEAVT
ncbi:hypothetical protein BGY98DRAFT_1181644 [Russula aff. rugulosa BPL654]|nr:hypothetical protein BGY98DRAFT_1181644 [Russula aff. rugulosa BPL654]